MRLSKYKVISTFGGGGVLQVILNVTTLRVTPVTTLEVGLGVEGFRVDALLGGSCVVISRVICPLIWVMNIATLLITALITTREPPSRASGLGNQGLTKTSPTEPHSGKGALRFLSTRGTARWEAFARFLITNLPGSGASGSDSKP